MRLYTAAATAAAAVQTTCLASAKSPHARARAHTEFKQAAKNVDNYQVCAWLPAMPYSLSMSTVLTNLCVCMSVYLTKLRPRIMDHGFGEFDSVHPSLSILAAGAAVRKEDAFEQM